MNDIFQMVINNYTIVYGKIGILKSCQHRLYLSFLPYIILIGKENNVTPCMQESIFEIVCRPVKKEGGLYACRIMMKHANPFVMVRLK